MRHKHETGVRLSRRVPCFIKGPIMTKEEASDICFGLEKASRIVLWNLKQDCRQYGHGTCKSCRELRRISQEIRDYKKKIVEVSNNKSGIFCCGCKIH